MTSGDQTAGTDSGRPSAAGADSGTGQPVAPAAGGDAGTGQPVVSAWHVLGPLMDLVTPMALRVAATLRLADFIPDDGTGDGAAISDLAERAGADPEALARMLRHLVAHGVFAEPRPGTVRGQPDRCDAAHRPAGRGVAGPGRLRRPDGSGVHRPGAHGAHRRSPAWEQVFGLPFWDYLDANPAISASFDATMAVDGGNIDVAERYDWAAVRHVADIGGGTGTLIAEVLQRNPGLRGTLADLPETAARARQYLAGLGLDGRCEVVGQSFFDPLPPGADAYLLNRVIHDWDDAAATAIFEPVRGGGGRHRPRARDRIARQPGGDPAAFAEMNLRMLVLAGGREHTLEDYSALAADADLEVTGVHDISERDLIIECTTK